MGHLLRDILFFLGKSISYAQNVKSYVRCSNNCPHLNAEHVNSIDNLEENDEGADTMYDQCIEMIVNNVSITRWYEFLLQLKFISANEALIQTVVFSYREIYMYCWPAINRFHSL